MAAQTTKLADTVHPLVRSGLDVDPSRGGLEQLDDIVLHPRLEVGHLGPLQNQRHVNVADLISVVGHHLVRMLHKFGRIAALPSRIGVLEHLTDIRQRQRTKDAIDDGMIYHISIGMCHDAQLSFVYATLFHVFAFGVGPLPQHTADNQRLHIDANMCEYLVYSRIDGIYMNNPNQSTPFNYK